MISSASICSVTRMVPMLEVMNDPTLPATMIEVKVGANSRINVCRVAKPIRLLGIRGLSIFSAICIAITAPTKREIKAMIPNEPYIRSSISLRMSFLVIDHLVRLRNISYNIKKYLPIASICFIVMVWEGKDTKIMINATMINN